MSPHAHEIVEEQQLPLVSTREIRAMLSISHAVSHGGSLSRILDQVSREAARVVSASSGAVLLLRGASRLRLAGSYGLSGAYSRRVADVPIQLGPGRGPAGLAISTDAPVVVDDVATDPRLRPWAQIAADEGYGAVAAVPLKVADEVFGALTVYRTDSGPWAPAEIDLLRFFAEHAALAIKTAQLIERQRHQLGTQARLVRGLRSQAHEHANRIHALSVLLSLGDVEEARRFAEGLEVAYESAFGAIADRIVPAPLAALIVAEMSIATQQGVAIRLSKDSRLTGLPPTLEDAEAVTIAGNLLNNAIESVVELPRDGRFVDLAVREDNRTMTIEVTNPLPETHKVECDRLFDPGYTSKAGHSGIGLTLVESAVRSAFGTVEATVGDRMTFRVSIPRE